MFLSVSRLYVLIAYYLVRSNASFVLIGEYLLIPSYMYVIYVGIIQPALENIILASNAIPTYKGVPVMVSSFVTRSVK